jgi:hypothetical protein
MFERFIPEENNFEGENKKRELSPIELEARFNMGRTLMHRDLMKAGFSPDSPDEEVNEYLHSWMNHIEPKFIELFDTMMKENPKLVVDWQLHPTDMADKMERRFAAVLAKEDEKPKEQEEQETEEFKRAA